jgi:hypothetical protein
VKKSGLQRQGLRKQSWKGPGIFLSQLIQWQHPLQSWIPYKLVWLLIIAVYVLLWCIIYNVIQCDFMTHHVLTLALPRRWPCTFRCEGHWSWQETRGAELSDGFCNAVMKHTWFTKSHLVGKGSQSGRFLYSFHSSFSSVRSGKTGLICIDILPRPRTWN